MVQPPVLTYKPGVIPSRMISTPNGHRQVNHSTVIRHPIRPALSESTEQCLSEQHIYGGLQGFIQNSNNISNNSNPNKG